MDAAEKETLWLHFVLSYQAVLDGDLDKATAHSQQAHDMLTKLRARKQQSKMAIDSRKFRSFRKAS